MLGVTLTLQGMIPCWAYFTIISRLQTNPLLIEIQLLNKPLRMCCLMYVLSNIFGAYAPLVLMGPDNEGSLNLLYAFSFLFAEFAVSSMLTSTLYFVAIDCRVSCSLIRKLSELRQLKLLTFEDYHSVRKVVSAREARLQNVLDAMIFVAFLSIIMTLIQVFFDIGRGEIEQFLVIISPFCKEIPFLLMVYWEITTVNDTFDLFVSELSCLQWCNAESHDELGYSHNESIRLAILASCQATPITTRLMGKSVRRRNFMCHLSVLCIVLLVSIVRCIYTYN